MIIAGQIIGIDETQTQTVYQRLSQELRTARLSYFNALHMLKLANRGQVRKDVAFSLLNKERAKYMQAIRLTVRVLDFMKRARIQVVDVDFGATYDLS